MAEEDKKGTNSSGDILGRHTFRISCLGTQAEASLEQLGGGNSPLATG